jgi:hypothetical protein
MKKMPTVMKSGHDFSRVPSVSIERSVFDRSHGYKTTFDAGLLIPVFVDEVLPGDTFHLRMTAFARLTTPIKPLMDNMYLDSFFFFVPYRLVWTNFVKFMGEQTNPGDSISFTVPQVGAMTPGLGSVWDYFGLPCTGQLGAGTIQFSTLPFRAYSLIYNQWFRDENLINSVSVPVSDGPDAWSGAQAPFKRAKRHDYFTSCLPFLQKGTAVSMPLGTRATVVLDANVNLPHKVVDATTLAGIAGALTSQAASFDFQANAIDAILDPNGVWYADLSTATAATINDLRLAFQTQKLLERDARGGTRYTELIWSHFRVKSPDARLQRSEYLGGGSTPVSIAPIAQQTQTGLTGGNTPIGNLSGVGAALAHGHGFSKSFTEHGIIIGIVNVRADLTYQQGIERFWKRSTRYDFYWPVLAHIGEQSVLNRELYAKGDANDPLVFGYQERYAEYRYKPSRITGLMNSMAAGTLELWHLSEKFTALPTLGQTFIEDQTESILDTRVAVPSEPDFYFDAYFDLKCARPMPVFGVPGMTDHF